MSFYIFLDLLVSTRLTLLPFSTLLHYVDQYENGICSGKGSQDGFPSVAARAAEKMKDVHVPACAAAKRKLRGLR